MAFIDTSKDHRLPWYVRLFFWNQRRRYGSVLEPARLWGLSLIHISMRMGTIIIIYRECLPGSRHETLAVPHLSLIHI